ncbi:MAG: YafY family protein, partial [Microbacteriaceae bacterium]
MAETTSRTLALLSLLQTHRQWSGPELAQRLGVTERTLRRDIDRLRELGYRVDAARGAAGGYRLEAGSQLPPLLLTDDEAVTMAIGLRISATRGLVDGEQTSLSALAKFEQVLPSALRRRVNALAGSVQAGGMRPQLSRDALVSSGLLGQLALACRDHERIRFHYVAASGAGTDRVVEPHTLVAAERSWFLVCWDLQRGDWRTFRVDRMSLYFATRLHFVPRELPAANAAEFVTAAIASMRPRVQAEVVMRMPLAAMREQFGPWAEGAVAIDADTTSWPIGGDT